MNLKNCPHCRRPVKLITEQYGFSIVCTGDNCLGGMSIRTGSDFENLEKYKQKLISNWNQREPQIEAVEAASRCISNYRDEIWKANQEPFSEFCGNCVDVLDEALNRLMCFTCQEAVDAWEEKDDG